MSTIRRAGRRLLPVALTLLLVLGLAVARAAVRRSASVASTPQTTAPDQLEPDLGIPTTGTTVFGASPVESAGEAWAYGYVGDVPATVGGKQISDQWVLLKREDSGQWQIAPLPDGSDGSALATASNAGPSTYGTFAAEATPAGGVVLLTGQNVVVRNPGGSPYLAATPGSALQSGESLVNPGAYRPVTIPYAPVDESGGHTGVLIAPYDDGASGNPGVLHFGGASRSWSREPIGLGSGQSAGFTPLALRCGPGSAAGSGDSPDNCWLLASSGSGSSTQLDLFRRVASSDASGYSWVQQPVSDWLLGSAQPPSGAGGSPQVAALAQGAQMLTVTSQGLWVDFSATVSGTQRDVSELVIPGSVSGQGGASPNLSDASVSSSWCYPTVSWCAHSLGQSLPTTYRSFAWPGSGQTDSGSRIVTGLDNSALLELSASGNFAEYPGSGAGATTTAAVAFASPQLGFQSNGSEAFTLTTSPQASELRADSLPFEHPLLAVATAPGVPAGSASSSALAVGLDGEVGRYTAQSGWQPESLLNGAGVAQTPTLRGVAWPEPDRAYAVGDNCAMWVYEAATKLWESDPAKPYNCTKNFTAIAFEPGSSSDGYAVGKDGLLLAYNKTWQQVTLPVALMHVDFTSISFAGSEALATYRYITGSGGSAHEAGGLAVDDGSGWQVDSGAAALFASLPSTEDTVLSKVAGLTDGGAVAAGPGVVIERDSASGAWHLTADPLPAANVSALAAYRDGSGQVRAVLSAEEDSYLNPNFDQELVSGPYRGDVPYSSSETTIVPADPLPDSGYLLEQTDNGWVDMEHQDYPSESANSDGESDGGLSPDPVLALAVAADGSEGLAVGGQTGDADGSGAVTTAETAGAQRWGTGQTVSDASTTAIASDSGQASFVLAGDAACIEPCASRANDGIGPDLDLIHALQEASQIANVRGFLYAGGRFSSEAGQVTGTTLSTELDRFSALLGSGPSSLPVHLAASADLDASGAAESTFASALSSYAPAGTVPAGWPPAPSGTAAYAFESQGSAGGPVAVIVLDFSTGGLGSAQESWLQSALAAAKQAKVPALVTGADALGFSLPASGSPQPTQATDAATVRQILVQGGASAYLFDYPQANVEATVSYGNQSIPAYGSGTLGYVVSLPGYLSQDELGSSAFLVISVDTAGRNASTNVAPVTATATPNIGSLALDAEGGLLLRRSEVALFDALARRPVSGVDWEAQSSGDSVFGGAQPYDPLPFDCEGSNCAYQIPEQVTFTSSQADIGNFVEHDSTSANDLAVKLGANGKPIADSSSGLFCAYNAGTTTVTVAAGGLSFSLPVTVQAGTVAQPCQTVPLTSPPAKLVSGVAPLAHTAGSSPGGSPSSIFAPHVPAVHAPAPHTTKVLHYQPLPGHTQLATFFPFVVIVPPATAQAARPTPPSGTAEVQAQSPISENVIAPDREQEHEHATQHVHNAVAHRLRIDRRDAPAAGYVRADAAAQDQQPLTPWLLGLVLPVALIGTGIARRRPHPRPAFARVASRQRRRRS